MSKAAIQASRFDAFWIEPEKLTLVTNKSSPFYQSRVEDPPQPGAVASMKAIGFMSDKAISVFKDGPKLYVLDGRGRTLAALEANRQLKKEGREPIRVSLIIKRGTEAELYASMCAANENRRDVSDVERAKELSKLMAYGKTVEEAGAVLGLNKGQASQRLAVLDCAAAVQHAVETKQLPLTGAYKLSKLERKEQVTQLAKMIEEAGGERVRVTRAAKAVKESRGESTIMPPTRKVLRATLERAEADEDTADLRDVLRWAVTGVATGDFGKWLAKAKTEVKASTTPILTEALDKPAELIPAEKNQAGAQKVHEDLVIAQEKAGQQVDKAPLTLEDIKRATAHGQQTLDMLEPAAKV